MPDKQPSIRFRLDPRAAVAPYRQLVEQVRHAVSSGLLRGGDQLPSVRDVVSHISINPNTVHRAYRELEYLGIAEGRTGLGTFITSNALLDERVTNETVLSSQLLEWVRRAHKAGLDDARITEIVEQVLRQSSEVFS